MSILSRIFRDTSASPEPAQGNRCGNYANGNLVTIGTRGDAGLSVAAYYRALTLRANTMSQLLLKYQRFNSKGRNYEEDTRPRGSRLNWLLQVRPNPSMSWPLLMRMAEIKRITEGNAYIYIERMGAEVEALWLCQGASYDQTSDTYMVTYGPDSTTCSADAHDVIHLRNDYTDHTGMTGIPTLQYMQRTLSIAATNDRLVLENAAKGGKLKLILQEEKSSGFGIGKANKAELEKIAAKLQQDIYNKDVSVINNIANVTPISQNMQQQEIQVARQFSVREIARYMGVPSIMLMDDTNSSYKSPEAATLEFLSRTIAPLIREFEAEANSKLLDFSDYGVHRLHLCEEPLYRLDPKTRSEVDKNNYLVGVKTTNELRAEHDMPAVKDGDKVYISTNLAELGSKKLSGEDTNQQAEEGGEDA